MFFKISQGILKKIDWKELGNIDWKDYGKKFDWKSLRNVIGSVNKHDWESLIKFNWKSLIRFNWKSLIKSSWKSLGNFLKRGLFFKGKVTPQKKTALLETIS